MNRLSREKRAKILGMLVEGVSIRAISRMTGASKNTVVKLLADAGQAFSEYQDQKLHNLPCKRIQLDDIWSFVYPKVKNVPCAVAAPEIAGDVWTWTAIDADTKLIVSWLVGDRSGETACRFVRDFADRLKHRVQITTDGHKAYLQAIEEALGNDAGHAMLERIYAAPSQTGTTRYRPAECCGTRTHRVIGNPDPAHTSASFAERQNLSMRMSIRCFTRLTNAFSKKIENHLYAISIYFMHYNFCRIHQTLRVTPAMEAGIVGHVWSLEELVALIDSN
ncbi:MAG: DDE-type integrase/transposase/recombinase [Nitrospirae bacterium]|nr:DDE-type integrase/transposase/recombinase [Nitrospirota bacterium]